MSISVLILNYSKQLTIKQKYDGLTWFSIYGVIITCTLLGMIDGDSLT